MNGQPPHHLPESVTSHYLYKRHFGSSVFRVVPHTLSNGLVGQSTPLPCHQDCTVIFIAPGERTELLDSTDLEVSWSGNSSESNDSDIEVDEVRGSEFCDSGQAGAPEVSHHAIPSLYSLSDVPAVYEERNGRLLQLLHPAVFCGPDGTCDVPIHFLLNFSIWLDGEAGNVLFRPLEFTSDDFCEKKFCLDLGSRTLTMYGKLRNSGKMVEPAFLVEQSSRLGQKLLGCLGKLELAHHIEIWRDKRGTVCAQLPRLQLTFTRQAQSSDINCEDLKDFVVDLDQQLGVFPGLRQGLVLVKKKAKWEKKRCLLLPHAPISIESRQRVPDADGVHFMPHHMTKLQLHDLKAPRYFCFDFDVDLKQLRAPRSRAAWLYLAALHATSSGNGCDSFTGLTGMEMALHILESPRCWASSPLDSESVYWLDTIAKLSPWRSHHPREKKLMEIVSWPKAIPSLCAHDGYRLLVLRILESNQQLNFMYSHAENPASDLLSSEKVWQEFRSGLKKKKASRSLYERAYALSWYSYPVMARLQKDWVQVEGQQQATRDQVWKMNLRVKRVFDATTSESSLSTAGWMDVRDELLQVGDNEGQEEMKEFASPGSVGKDVSCQFWHCYDICSNFLALHQLIMDQQDLMHQDSMVGLHFQLLLSFLVYRCQQAGSCQMVLAELLVGLVSASPVEVPGLRYFPVPEPLLEASLFSKYVLEKSKYFDLNAIDSEDDDEDYYCKTRELRKLIAEDVERASQFLHRSVFNGKDRDDESPAQLVPPFPLVRKIQSCFHIKRYERAFFRKVEAVNRWNVLANYARRLHKSIASLPCLPPNEPGEFHKCSLATRPPVAFVTVFYSPPKPEQVNRLYLVKDTRCSKSMKATKASKSSSSRNLVRKLAEKVGGHGDNVSMSFASSLHTSWEALKSDASHCQPSAQGSIGVDKSAIETDFKGRSYCVAVVWQKLEKSFMDRRSQSFSLQCLDCLDLLARCHPLHSFCELLPDFARRKHHELVKEHQSDLLPFLIELAVLIVQLQRLRRMLHHLCDGQFDWYLKEAENIPHRNWLRGDRKPSYELQWLLFEVENDVCIRSQQISVAQHMLQGHASRHLVTQLNMGEGKTRVIVPLLLLSLGNGDCLARLLVLLPLLTTSSNLLTFQLGGLLNRQIVEMPFERTIELTQENIAMLIQSVMEWRQQGSLLVSVREHVLSLFLKFYEAAYNCHLTHHGRHSGHFVGAECSFSECLAGPLFNLVDRLHPIRDVIDEADEVLHHRFHLVYPVGLQSDPDGQDLRWEIPEYILQLVCELIPRLKRKYRNSIIFAENDQSEMFPSGLRFLESEACSAAYDDLCQGILSEVFACEGRTKQPGVFTELRAKLGRPHILFLCQQFLKSEELSKQAERDFAKLVTNCDLSERVQCALLGLRGLLAHKVLLFCLMKRFRVDFGLVQRANTPQPRKGRRHIALAVPFRAKDVPAENTEFGHPDVAVVLTLISYYHQGLSLSQVHELLNRLERKEACCDIFRDWVIKAKLCPVGASEFISINRQDPQQMKEVHRFLSRNMLAVNFFLNNVIFPKELKVFKTRISTNSWSLVPESPRPHCCGFSGTNDTELLLPGFALQNDLKEVVKTNALVCQLVLSAENDSYRTFQTTLDSSVLLEEILRFQTEGSSHGREINALIDVGACVVDEKNAEFAWEWLKKRKNMRAVVYFDGNELFVRDRQSPQGSRLDLSFFARDLSDCLVYIDHQHTRGTDLAMPRGTRAAVTLGKQLRKDELVQACMRMRRLGYGHSVTFFAPKDVDRMIQKTGNGHHFDVLLWTFHNSTSAIEQGLFQWGKQGMLYHRLHRAELEAHHSFHTGCHSTAVQRLAESCTDDDAASLAKMYGRAQTLASVATNVRRLCEGKDEVHYIVKHCKHYGSTCDHLLQDLDGEQERELQQEREEERQSEKPPKAQASEEVFPTYLLERVKTGKICLPFDQTSGPMPVSLWWSLEGTEMRENYPSAIYSRFWNQENLVATVSFANTVVRCTGGYTDLFLRPVEWLLVLVDRDQISVVVLSPYQASKLVEFFYKHPNKWRNNVALHMYASPVVPGQRNPSDQPIVAAGHNSVVCKIPQAHDERQASIFAELFCYSGGLYFPEDKKQAKETMESLARLLDVSPFPGESPSQQEEVGVLHSYHSAVHCVNSEHDALPLLGHLYCTLYDKDTVWISQMGQLLFRRQWPVICPLQQPTPPYSHNEIR